MGGKFWYFFISHSSFSGNQSFHNAWTLFCWSLSSTVNIPVTNIRKKKKKKRVNPTRRQSLLEIKAFVFLDTYDPEKWAKLLQIEFNNILCCPCQFLNNKLRPSNYSAPLRPSVLLRQELLCRWNARPAQTRASGSTLHFPLEEFQRWGLYPPSPTTRLVSATPVVLLRVGPASCWHPPGLRRAPRPRPGAPAFEEPALAGTQASRRWARTRTWGRSSSSSGGTDRGWSCRTRTRSACGGTAPAGPPGWACVCARCPSSSPSSCSLRMKIRRKSKNFDLN